MDEIGTLKEQKEGLIKDMINNKQNQMEDDHKLFQQKLDELKNSMLQGIQIPKEPPVLSKGNDILAELDRMKERLQRKRNSPNKPREHPSTISMQNIIIDNPIADNAIDPVDYFPIKKSLDNNMDKSLPGMTALKTGLNSSQNFKSENEKNLNKMNWNKDEDSIVNIKSPLLENPKHKKRKIIVNKVSQPLSSWLNNIINSFPQ